MDKIKLTKEMLESGKSFEEVGIKIIELLPYLNCEECAAELVQNTFILDESGVAYEAHTTPLMKEFLAAKYFTNINTDDWDTHEGRAALYDFFCRVLTPKQLTNCCWASGWSLVEEICYHLKEALEKKHEHENSLGYKIGNAFGSILDGDGDIIQRIADSRDISEKMIDMIKVFNDHKKTAPAQMKMFAKK